jgi:hypothetical protein
MLQKNAWNFFQTFICLFALLQIHKQHSTQKTIQGNMEILIKNENKPQKLTNHANR